MFSVPNRSEHACTACFIHTHRDAAELMKHCQQRSGRCYTSWSYQIGFKKTNSHRTLAYLGGKNQHLVIIIFNVHGMRIVIILMFKQLILKVKLLFMDETYCLSVCGLHLFFVCWCTFPVFCF